MTVLGSRVSSEAHDRHVLPPEAYMAEGVNIATVEAFHLFEHELAKRGLEKEIGLVINGNKGIFLLGVGARVGVDAFAGEQIGPKNLFKYAEDITKDVFIHQVCPHAAAAEVAMLVAKSLEGYADAFVGDYNNSSKSGVKKFVLGPVVNVADTVQRVAKFGDFVHEVKESVDLFPPKVNVQRIMRAATQTPLFPGTDELFPGARQLGERVPPLTISFDLGVPCVESLPAPDVAAEPVESISERVKELPEESEPAPSLRPRELMASTEESSKDHGALRLNTREIDGDGFIFVELNPSEGTGTRVGVGTNGGGFVFAGKCIKRAFFPSTKDKKLVFAGNEYPYKMTERNGSCLFQYGEIGKINGEPSYKIEKTFDLSFWDSKYERKSVKQAKAFEFLLPEIQKDFQKSISALCSALNESFQRGNYGDSDRLVQAFYHINQDHPSAKAVFDKCSDQIALNRFISELNPSSSAEELHRAFEMFSQRYCENEQMLELIQKTGKEMVDSITMDRPQVASDEMAPLNKDLQFCKDQKNTRRVVKSSSFDLEEAQKKNLEIRRRSIAVGQLCLIGLDVLDHELGKNKKYMSQTSFAASKSFSHGARACSIAYLGRFKPNSSGAFTSFSVGLHTAQASYYGLRSLYPFVKSYLPQSWTRIESLQVPEFLDGAANLAGQAAYGYDVTRTTADVGLKFYRAWQIQNAVEAAPLFNPDVLAACADLGLLVLPVAARGGAGWIHKNYYQPRRREGDAPESYLGNVAETACDAAQSSYTWMGVSAVGVGLAWIDPTGLVLGGLAVKSLVGTAVGGAAVAYCAKSNQQANIQQNVGYRYIDTFFSPAKNLEQRHKLDKVVQESKKRLDLENPDYEDLWKRVFDKLDTAVTKSADSSEYVELNQLDVKKTKDLARFREMVEEDKAYAASVIENFGHLKSIESSNSEDCRKAMEAKALAVITRVSEAYQRKAQEYENFADQAYISYCYQQYLKAKELAQKAQLHYRYGRGIKIQQAMNRVATKTWSMSHSLRRKLTHGYRLGSSPDFTTHFG